MASFGKPTYDADRVESELSKRMGQPEIDTNQDEPDPSNGEGRPRFARNSQEAPSSNRPSVQRRQPESETEKQAAPQPSEEKPSPVKKSFRPNGAEAHEGQVARPAAPPRHQNSSPNPGNANRATGNSDARPSRGYIREVQENVTSVISGLPLRLERLIDEVSDYLGYGEKERQDARQKAATNPAAMEERLTKYRQEKILPARRNSAQSLQEAMQKNPGQVVYAQVEPQGTLSFMVLDPESEEGQDNKILHGAIVEMVAATRTPFSNLEEIFPNLGAEPEAVLEVEETALNVPESADTPQSVPPQNMIDEQYGNVDYHEEERVHVSDEDFRSESPTGPTPDRNTVSSDNQGLSYYTENGEMIVYTDGACKNNPGIGGWGAHFEHEGKSVSLYGGNSYTTNNKMELEAIVRSLIQLKEYNCQEPVCIMTDSEYARKGLLEWRKGWEERNWMTRDQKPVKNKEIWQELFKLVDEFNAKMPANQQLNIKWVKGHSNDPGNELADQLANKGTDLARNKKDFAVAFVQVDQELVKEIAPSVFQEAEAAAVVEPKVQQQAPSTQQSPPPSRPRFQR